MAETLLPNDEEVISVNDDRACVIRSLESMASELEGKPIVMSNKERLFRINQVEDAGKLAQKRIGQDGTGFIAQMIADLKAREIKHLIGRMDQIGTHNFMVYLQKQGTSEVADVFRHAEIRFLKGGVEEASKLVREGNVVGVVTKIVKPDGEFLHVFHFGLDVEGNPTNKSDFQPPESVTGDFVDVLDEFMKEPQNLTQGWGLIAVKKKLS